MPDIQHSVQIAAKPETIYPLVATADGLRKWWATDVTQTDGAVDLAFFNRTTVYRLRRTVDKPPTEVEWNCETGQEWTGTRISFRLEAGESGTLLRFTHADWQSASDYFVSCNTAWGELMYRLKAAAQGKAPGPLFSAAHPRTSGTTFLRPRTWSAWPTKSAVRQRDNDARNSAPDQRERAQ